MSKNNSSTAILLSAIRALSIVINLFSSAVLSRTLTLESYGTYAAGNLVISVFTNATLLGMMDAANFFYHQKKLDQQDSINTIFFIQTVIGVCCAAVILLGQNLITDYFNNPLLQGIYLYIAFRPLLGNLYNMLMTLQISIGETRKVAIRKALMAAVRLVAVLITSFITKDIRTIFLAYLLFDTATILYFQYTFGKSAFPIRPFLFKSNLIRPILIFAVPMGVYSLANTLSRDIDKLVIGRFFGAPELAIYTNCGAALPFDIITSTFLTIVIPIMTRLIQNNRLDRAGQLLRAYLSTGILSTMVFTSACMILSEEVILLLYGREYLAGKTVFILYTLVDMVKFANISLVLSAKGETRKLMVISLTMLGLNAILNLVLYAAVGFLGPVIATVLVTLLTTVVLLTCSARILNSNLICLFDLKLTGKVFLTVILLGTVSMLFRQILINIGIHYFFRLVAIGLFYCGGVVFCNKNEIIRTFRALNHERLDGDGI